MIMRKLILKTWYLEGEFLWYFFALRHSTHCARKSRETKHILSGKQAMLLFFLYYLFGLRFPEAITGVTDLVIHAINFYNVPIDAPLKWIKELFLLVELVRIGEIVFSLYFSFILQSKVCHWKKIVLITQFSRAFIFLSTFYNKRWPKTVRNTSVQKFGSFMQSKCSYIIELTYGKNKTG